MISRTDPNALPQAEAAFQQAEAALQQAEAAYKEARAAHDIWFYQMLKMVNVLGVKPLYTKHPEHKQWEKKVEEVKNTKEYKHLAEQESRTNQPYMSAKHAYEKTWRDYLNARTEFLRFSQQ